MKRLSTILIVMILLIAVPIETFAVSKPAQVKNLKASAKTSVSITMKWSKAKGAKGYEVQQYDTKAKKWKALKKVSALNYKNTKLKANTLYKYRVRAYTSYKQYYNTKTKKWVNKKPAANAWKTKKSRTVYVYGKVSSVLTVRTSKAATTPQPAKPAHNHSWSDWQVTTEPTTTSTGVKTRRCSCGATETQTIPKLTGYTYSIHLINEPYGNGGLTAIYLKTNNPTPYTYHIRLKDSSNQEKDINIQTTIDSECNEGFYNDIDSSTLKGKIFICSPNYTGNCKIEVFEFSDEGRRTVASKNIYIRNYSVEETTWMNSVINQVTTPEMSKQDKMWAICEHILRNFTYTTNDGSHYITLITKVGQPYWVQKKTNSAESPAELVKFGNLLNYPLKNMYAEYPDGTLEWHQYHMFARSIEDGTDYWCCPALDTGTIDPSTIQMFDPDTFQFWGE